MHTRSKETLAVGIERWEGCYDQGWKGLISDQSFSHPAKMARGLVVRIFDELFAMGALEKADMVCDPFAGIGSTGIECAPRGLRFIGCELEPRFVELARENFELHRRDWEAMGLPQPVICQGDSRRLREVLRAADCLVSSPPYADGALNDSQRTIHRDGLRPGFNEGDGGTYGREAGQLGTLTDRGVDAVIASPPYADTVNAKDHGIDWSKADPKVTGGRRRGEDTKHGQTLRNQLSYGAEEEGQLGAMMAGDVAAVISSPPFGSGDSASAQSIAKRTDKSAAWIKGHTGSACTEGYGETAGQLGEMKMEPVDALVSSPPWEHQEPSHAQGSRFEDIHRRLHPTKLAKDRPGLFQHEYGTTVGQLGQTHGDTFWSAALEVVRESYAILRPGGCAVFVVKHFVRSGKLVDFPGDWRKLCEHVGFETVKEVHAMLVSEETKPDLFDGARVVQRKRASFFRRLYENKHPENAITYETVLFLVKPR